MIRNGMFLPFAGLILAVSIKQTQCPETGRIFNTQTITNMAALKHFGGSRPPRGANDNQIESRVG
jgi:hypothetical protein